MTALSELLPEAKSLSRIDKLKLIQVLVEDLAGVESGQIKLGQQYEVWSPDSAFPAADAMLRALANEARS